MGRRLVWRRVKGLNPNNFANQEGAVQHGSGPPETQHQPTSEPMRQRSPITPAITSTPGVVEFSPDIPL